MAIKIIKENCTGCGDCVEVCPVEAITLVDDIATVNEDDCSECGACEAECSNGAIQLV